MSRTRYKIFEAEYPYFITSNVVDGYPLFSKPLAAEIILKGLAFLQDKRKTTLCAYVIMENHIHFIAQSLELQKHLRALKSWTAREIINQFTKEGHTHQLAKLKQAKRLSHIDSDYQVWEEGFFPKQITSDAMMLQKMEYIHNNPVRRGFVDLPEDWRYSSARNYLGIEGLIPVTLFGDSGSGAANASLRSRAAQGGKVPKVLRS